MLYYAMMFLVVGLIVGTLNLMGVFEVAVEVSWILYGVGMVLVMVHLFTSRAAPRAT